jgi:signal transduction histidine kinase/ActR/RegA family two-component response regulator
MTDARSLTDRTLDQIVAHLQDHQPALIEFSTRMEPHATALIDAWIKTFRELIEPLALNASTIHSSKQATFAQTFFGQMKQGNLRQALASFAEWSTELATATVPYDVAHQLFRAQQQATLTQALSAYQNDPQLPIVLDALDDWFDGAVTVASAAYIDLKPAAREMPTPGGVSDERQIDSARLRVLGQLTDGMTHALNNLFAALIGQTQLIIERVADYSLRDELLELQSTALAGARAIRRIQEYARASTQPKQAVDVNLALRDAAEITRFLWRDQAEANGIVIDVVKDFADVPPALARPGELRQALVELILNAIDALPNGGLITLHTERKNNSVLISIIDNGIGMTDEVRTRATEPRFTTKAAPHLGLGMHHVAQIITEHYGTLVIDSTPQRGTTVTLSLPMAHPAVEKKDKKIMPAQRPAHILIIDNEPSVRALLARLLTIQGHSVVSAESGAEGINVFKREKFDAVFTDLGMPEMSGWDVAREIKKLNANTLIALTTGWPIDLTEDELKAKNVDRVISKPFDLPTLYALIDEAVARSDAK